jgi:hypothetical protein
MLEIHAILMLVPKLGDLLKTIPELKVTMNELRRTGLEAASHLSLLVIEKLIRSIPAETLALTFQQLFQNTPAGALLRLRQWRGSRDLDCK